ncbi:MAG: class F sortase [Chloroflexota bacterium]
MIEDPTPTPIPRWVENIIEIDPLPREQALAPSRLQIPAIDFDANIVEMGWVAVDNNGARTTKWVVPAQDIGWHVNSVGAGGQGNLILSGHQAVGGAVFAVVSLGDVVIGHDLLVTDGEGLTFVYRVTEVSEPIPLTGTTEEEELLVSRYSQVHSGTDVDSSDTAQTGGTSDDGIVTSTLTMMTGWPEFTTTHRLFVVAEFVGLVN